MSLNVDYRNICRICLSQTDLSDVLKFGVTSLQWVGYIQEYYQVQITSYERKSTKLCKKCIENVNRWRRIRASAQEAQDVINNRQKLLQEEEKHN